MNSFFSCSFVFKFVLIDHQQKKITKLLAEDQSTTVIDDVEGQDCD